MQTSRFVLGLAGLLAATSLRCAAGNQCDQFSDCAQGYTCAAGQCVLPPAADAGPEAAAAARLDSAVEGAQGNVPEATSSQDSGSVRDAGGPADVGTDGATPSDAPSETAPSDTGSLDSGAIG
jgi:hypothetical protein